MKKTFASFLIALGVFAISMNAQAQELGTARQSIFSNDLDAVPGLTKGDLLTEKSNKAMWDILFNYNLTDSSAGLGCAAVCYTNSEFWVSRWANDTLIELDQTGSFQTFFTIAGLTGVRSFTKDASYVYAGNNTTTIYRINPLTKVLAPPHITVAAGARWVTYDPTLDGGAGGFWYGNFNTDIIAINMTGTPLDTILVATHGLDGMYGAAYDNVSSGGPYLWIFAQMPPNDCQVKALSLPSGTVTVYDHDVMSDVGLNMSLSSALAGGLFLSTDVSPGNVTLVGIAQGTPDNILFGYDLDLLGAFDDLEAVSLRSTEGYYQIPITQAFAETFELSVRNAGTSTIDSVYADFDFSYNGTPVFSETFATTNLASAATHDFVSSGFTPSFGLGEYTVDVTCYTGMAQNDTNALNDTISFSFWVTDSVYARDNGVDNGGAGYGVSSVDWAYATSNFELFNPDTLGGVWIQLVTSVQGDTTYAVLVSTTAGVPTTVLETGPIQIIDSTQNQYFLPFTTPVPLVAGTYAIGCYEVAGDLIYLAQGANIYTPGVNYFYTSGAGWTASGIQTARFIRPYLAHSTSIGIDQADETASRISVYPNPASDMIYLGFSEVGDAKVLVRIMEPSGRIVSEKTIFVSNNTSAGLNVSTIPQGFYFMEIRGENFRELHKILISR